MAVRLKVAEVEEEDILMLEEDLLMVEEVLVLLVEEELVLLVVLAFEIFPSALEPCQHPPRTLSCQGPCSLSPPLPSRLG